MASVENDSVMVSFGFEGNALFSADALLVLRNADDIIRDVLNGATLFPFYDYYDILDMLALAGNGIVNEKRRFPGLYYDLAVK